MIRQLLFFSILLLTSIRSAGFQPTSLSIEVISFQSDSLELSILSSFTDGPPAPDFLGLWESNISNDTLYVHPLYEFVGAAGSFASGRFDTVKLWIPPGVQKVKLHSGMRQFSATPPIKDTVLSNYDTTLVLSALSLRNVDLVSSFLLFPNPVRATIKTEQAFDTFEILNILGSKILTGNNQSQIDVSMLHEGL